ncbi:hypothetical protein HY546_02175 [archaeon]|nr:hypothetical protein [archaeon]
MRYFMVFVHETGGHFATYVTISKDEYESMQHTIEILGDRELMDQIKESVNAKGVPWSKVKKELGL